jgi:DNA-binding beta-propeller fold protein YncE
MRRVLSYLSLCAVALAAAATPAAAEVGWVKAWGSEGTGPDQFRLPDGITVDTAGSVFVADRDNNRLLRFDSEGRPREFPAFRRQRSGLQPGRFRLPYDVAADALGNLYVADTHNHRIQQFTPDGRFIRMWGSLGTGDGQFNQPRDIAVDAFGNVWAADHENKRVQKFTRDGRFLLKVGANGGDGTLGSGPGEFNSPRGLSSDPAGNIYVADDANHRIVKLANDGRFIANFGVDGGGWDKWGPGPNQFSLPYGTAVDGEGHVWVADTENNRVEEIDPVDGSFLSVWGRNGGDGSAGPAVGEFDHPYNVATDCVGNVYVTDQGNHRVVKLGEAAAPPPVCPPRLSLGAAPGQRGRTLVVEAACDRACRASAVARVRLPDGVTARFRSPTRTLWGKGLTTLSLRLPARVRSALAGGQRLTAVVTVTAQGAPGAEHHLKRNVSLR